MSACRTLVRSSLSLSLSLSSISLSCHRSVSFSSSNLWFTSLLSRNQGLGFYESKGGSTSYGCVLGAVSKEIESSSISSLDESFISSSSVEPSEELVPKVSVGELLVTHQDDVARFMKMERKSEVDNGGQVSKGRRWFPYLDMFKSENSYLTSGEVIEAMDPHILDVRKEKIRTVVKNRTYSVCLVVEGLSDYGNVSAVFRSADALGFQSVHVVTCDSTKRYKDNRHVSMGAEKWLDIELWNSSKECFSVLKSRGYRIATTHVGMDAVSIYDMDWSCPTAIVVGNENRGISDEALELSDLHCSIPMKGMVDSFNVGCFRHPHAPCCL